jgi:hypothetical protein
MLCSRKKPLARGPAAKRGKQDVKMEDGKSKDDNRDEENWVNNASASADNSVITAFTKAQHCSTNFILGNVVTQLRKGSLQPHKRAVC